MSKKAKIFIGYLIIIHILLIIILFKPNLVPKAQSKLSGIMKNETEIIPRYYDIKHYNMMLMVHKWMDNSVPDDAVIFIGDSITQGLVVSNVSPKSVNFGIASDTTFGLLERLPDYNSFSRAKAIVLAIGVNDLRARDNNSIVENYKIILNGLPSNVPIIASAVLPIDETIRINTSNNRISRLNVALSSLSENYKNVRFINPSKQLMDLENNLSDSYHTGDGLHLNAKGYKIWVNELIKALKNT